MGLDPAGVFTYRDGVAIIQLFFFAGFFCLAFVLCHRHGWRRAEGWLVIIPLSILRLLGASFQLASIKHQTNAVYGGALICEEIGLAPLTLLNLGVFGRINKWVRKVSDKIFSAISLVAIAGLVLGIYGGIWSADSTNLGTNGLLKASVLCFTAAWLFFACLFVYFLTQLRLIPAHERPLLYCFAYCAPFMIVRLLYSILPAWVSSTRDNLNSLFGNVTIFLFMSVFAEIIIVSIYIFVGMRLENLPEELKSPPMSLKKNKKTRAEKLSESDNRIAQRSLDS